MHWLIDVLFFFVVVVLFCGGGGGLMHENPRESSKMKCQAYWSCLNLNKMKLEFGATLK